MLELKVRGGEIESEQQWVYAWIADDGVVYVGATALQPETRTWLHLHEEDPSIGRMRARFPSVTTEELDVLAMELPKRVDRQRIRDGSVTLLAERGLLSPRQVCDPAPTTEAPAETVAFVDGIETRLRCLVKSRRA
ncbi:MAG: hypothetical protein QOJ43_744 [Gaiellaceae bacterium]|jgi:hypothetical protein|nr:hypothetical protein [Gaiellaceae bacterium]